MGVCITNGVFRDGMVDGSALWPDDDDSRVRRTCLHEFLEIQIIWGEVLLGLPRKLKVVRPGLLPKMGDVLSGNDGSLRSSKDTFPVPVFSGRMGEAPCSRCNFRRGIFRL